MEFPPSISPPFSSVSLQTPYSGHENDLGSLLELRHF